MTEFFIKSTLSMMILLGLYHLLLEREKMHRFNRFFLLSSLVFSLALPLISIPVNAESGAATLVSGGTLKVMAIPAISHQTDYLFYILLGTYSTITSILSIRFGYNILQFFRKAASNVTISYEQATLVLLDEPVLPHTFLKYIFLHKVDYENKGIEKELYTHELTHV